jgi:predicted MFS family arabinose efflux permease
MSALESPPLLGSHTRRVFWGTILGNSLITYDFTVYSFFAVIIGKLFFPANSALASLLLSLVTFGAGSAMRPVGALVIGQLADRKGRKIALTITNALMLLGTAMLAFAPPYATLGIMATGLVVAARLMQGFAAGGEVGLSAVVLMELSDKADRCYRLSWRSCGQAAAAMLGALVGACTTLLLTPASLLEWGWRVPFVIGMLIGPVGWYIRRHMPQALGRLQSVASLKSILTRHPRTLLFGILINAAPTTGISLLVYYMPVYLTEALHMPPSISLVCACLSSAALILSVPVIAKIADRQMGRKPIQYLTLICSILLVFPVFYLLTLGVGELASLLLIAAYTVLVLGNIAVSTVMMLEAFATHQRATGMAIITSFSVALFGFTPMLVIWAIGVTGNPMASAWVLLAALSLSLLAVNRFPVNAN